MTSEKKIEDDDIDYQKDILQFKQIWKELKNDKKDENAEIEANRDINLKKTQYKKKEKEHQADQFKKESKSSKQTTPKVHDEKKSNKSNQLNRSQPEQKSPLSKQREQQKQEQRNHQQRKHSKEKKQRKKNDIDERNPKNRDPNVINIKTTHPNYQQKTDLLNQKNNTTEELFLMKPIKRSDEMEIFNYKQMIEQKNQEIALLRISNNRNHDKISHLQKEIQKRDKIIESMKKKQMGLEKNNIHLKDKQIVFHYGVVQYQNFKRDTKRLLKMLKGTQQYKTFANLALDDNNVRFLHEANKKYKTNLDIPNQNLHFCTCNKAFIPEPALWVPQNVYKYSKQFIESRKGDLSNAELQLLLYDLNKMWRQREKNIINSLNSIKANEIGVYRRKLQNYRHEEKGKIKEEY